MEGKGGVGSVRFIPGHERDSRECDFGLMRGRRSSLRLWVQGLNSRYFGALPLVLGGMEMGDGCNIRFGHSLFKNQMERICNMLDLSLGSKNYHSCCSAYTVAIAHSRCTTSHTYTNISVYRAATADMKSTNRR